MKEYQTQAARDAAANAYITSRYPTYADYVEQATLDMVRRRPTYADYLMNRSLSEALAGNDGA